MNKIIFQIFLKITKEDLEKKNLKTKINIKTLIFKEFKKIKKKRFNEKILRTKKNQN